MTSALLGKPSLGDRHLLMTILEDFNHPENIEPVSNGMFIDFIIEEKSIVCPFLVNDELIKVRVYVWGDFESVDRKNIPYELKTILFEIQGLFFDELNKKKVKPVKINSESFEVVVWEGL